MKRLKSKNEKEGLMNLKLMSQYNINNTLFSDKYMPLLDYCHGPYGMMPLELLYTSGSGLIKYMFESLRAQLGSGKDHDNIDKLHVRLYLTIKNQSEKDFSRGAMRNGLIDGTKCQSEERKGNLFLLLCIANTAHGGEKLQNGLGYSNAKWKKWLKFIKLYLSMEEWFHNCYDKEEVNNARPLICKSN